MAPSILGHDGLFEGWADTGLSKGSGNVAHDGEDINGAGGFGVASVWDFFIFRITHLPLLV
jgi:hypothetical protein